MFGKLRFISFICSQTYGFCSKKLIFVVKSALYQSAL
nr:MAG TPA: hypothetical protein [Caudoviricetes sp.]